MRIIFLSIILFHATALLAQSFTGTVVNEKRQALQEVHILNRSNERHTHSDASGAFSFERISIGDTLMCSHLGYENQEVIIDRLASPLLVILSQKTIDLGEIVISPGDNSLQIISDIDIQTRPVNSSQEVLRTVPGLIIGQHAGGGKAEQIFLRGFDLDHGTDIDISVDGMPVNMVSHAHGHGYADLHFVIPETVEGIDFGKGPYYENKGNFNTAGYVDFQTKDRLENGLVKMEVGQFDTNRLLGMFDLLSGDRHNAYIATEHLATDGPFESSQNFKRTNLFGKYAGKVTDSDKLELTFSHFTSKWDASGQIPQRAVDDGSITRFGAIDDTEGGSTSRTNVTVDYERVIDEHSSIQSLVYLSQYDFELFSNFTFFLEDSVNGDQIRQREDRMLYGAKSEYRRAYTTGQIEGVFRAGVQLRYDQSLGNELSRTLNRKETLETIQSGDINETNYGAYLGTSIHFGKWTVNPSLRFDHFDFQYNDDLVNQYETQAESELILSPKLNLFYDHSQSLQLYLKTGRGFHSNDTRVVVAQEGERILPAAYGGDVGFLWKPSSKTLVNLAYWQLYLEQEFVYVGDAGIVEPSGESLRQGIDLSIRYQPLPWLFWNLDANYAYARSIDEAEGLDYIPLAPDLTMVSGLTARHKAGWYGGLHVRYIKDRPANEDNSIVAIGYTVADFNLGYEWRRLGLGIQIQNLFDTDWNETQFATESRLRNETESVEEIHFTPGTPFFIRTMLQYSF